MVAKERFLFVFFLYLLLVLVRRLCDLLSEPVVEDVKVNKQMLADVNKLMADARIKGIKAVASLAGHTDYVRSVAFSPDGQHIVSGSYCEQI
jgi:WD40 repeat protein